MKANLISLWFVSTNAVNKITFLFTIPRKMCLHSNNNNNVTRYSFFNVCGCVGARAFPEIELNKIPSCTFINPVGIRKLINSYPRLLHNRDPYTHPSTCCGLTRNISLRVCVCWGLNCDINQSTSMLNIKGGVFQQRRQRLKSDPHWPLNRSKWYTAWWWADELTTDGSTEQGRMFMSQ